MPAKIFTPEMEEFLEHLIRTGLKGRIYEVIVLRKANQKIKLRDAWTFVQNKFNQKFQSDITKPVLQKKYSNMVLRRRKKAVSSFEKTKTGKGGPGILPP